MKKKLEDAYTPDKHARKEKVLIGLSGGLDSFVAAYLLKIQKYDLVAATVVNSWDKWEGDASSILSCDINQKKLDTIKEFCHRLNIPHHVLKSSSEFKEEVIEGWVGDRLSGKLPVPCWSCHGLRMRLLHEKMKEVGAKHLATGHFAKLFRPDGGAVFVHTSNDLENDQSDILSRIPNQILLSLTLPLSDLMKKEVVKLSENFGLQENSKKIKVHDCLSWTPQMKTIFEKTVPPSFMKGGETIGVDAQTYPPHEGMYEHLLGETYEYKDLGKPVKRYIGKYSHQEKRILIMNEDYFIRSDVHLVNCHFSEGTSWIEPIKGYVVVSADKMIECWIQPKSLSSAYIQMSEPAFLKEGEILSVIKKKGKNSKVYLTGRVHFLPLDPVFEEGEESVQKADRTRDY